MEREGDCLLTQILITTWLKHPDYFFSFIPLSPVLIDPIFAIQCTSLKDSWNIGNGRPLHSFKLKA